MKVWITYEKDGLGGTQVSEVFTNYDAAIRKKMDEFEYLKNGPMSNKYSTDEALKKYCDTHLHEMDTTDEY